MLKACLLSHFMCVLTALWGLEKGLVWDNDFMLNLQILGSS